MLEQQGLNLSDANVSTQSEQQQASAESHQEGRSDPSLEHAVETEEEQSVEHANVINVENASGVSIFA
jgi:flagellar hook-length control protein FliK